MVVCKLLRHSYLYCSTSTRTVVCSATIVVIGRKSAALSATICFISYSDQDSQCCVRYNQSSQRRRQSLFWCGDDCVSHKVATRLNHSNIFQKRLIVLHLEQRSNNPHKTIPHTSLSSSFPTSSSASYRRRSRSSTAWLMKIIA